MLNFLVKFHFKKIGMRNPFSVFRKNVGIDLGTANSLIYLSGRGIVINEPSCVAVNSKTGKVIMR
jgi:rod shape-determining protein MreB